MPSSSISEKFRELKRQGEAAYMPYVCCGDQGRVFSEKLIHVLCKSADLLELGIPFSDPIADGKVIQAASTRALENGTTPAEVFGLIKRLRAGGIEIPITIMTYYNIVYRAGISEFMEKTATSGAQGVLVVDAPIEESEEMLRESRRQGIDLIFLIAPTTPYKRLTKILGKARGFVYVVSVTGTTGSRKKVGGGAVELIKTAGKISGKPLCAGFGISEPRHVKEIVNAGASGIVEGSRLIEIYYGHKDNEKKALELIEKHAAKMKAATKGLKISEE